MDNRKCFANIAAGPCDPSGILLKSNEPAPGRPAGYRLNVIDYFLTQMTEETSFIDDDRGEAVTRLEDRSQIADLFHAYAYHFDCNQPESVAGLFTPDAVIDYGPEFAPISGQDQIVPRITPGLVETFAATSHHISNISIDFASPDQAAAVAYVYAWHRYRDGSPDGFLWGQYHTVARRTEQGWRFAQFILKGAGTADFHRSAMHPIDRAPLATGE